MRAQLRAARDRANNPSVTEAVNAYDEKLVAVAGQGGGGGRRGGGGGGGGGRGRGGASAGPSFASINGELMTLLTLIEDADAEPTTQATAAVRAVQHDFDALWARWTALRTTELAALNAKLKAAGQPAIAAP